MYMWTEREKERGRRERDMDRWIATISHLFIGDSFFF
jgi:hypothetical protein